MQNTNVYALLTPIVLVFILLEIVACWIFQKKYISFSESVASFGTQIGNQTTNVLMAVSVYYAYGLIWDNFRILTIPLNWWTFILLFLAIDFIFYWVHRWGHEINIMWAAHSPHHTAQEMNLIVALRTGITQRLLYFSFFWVMAVIGFHPIDIYAVVGLHVFIGFFNHTEFVRKLWRPLEYIFSTPSNHRVHHGVNPQYLDKNYGEFLIIWDRIFSTYEEEREKPEYGMLHHPNSLNPVYLNFHYYLILWKYAVAAPFWWDKIRIWFMPNGWIPRGLERQKTDERREKYSPEMFANCKPYLTFQVLLGIALMMGIISNSYGWTTAEKWLGAGLLWWQIINWSGILEGKTWLWLSEIPRNVVTLFAVIAFNEIYQPSALLMLLFITCAFSILWTLLYFRPKVAKLVPVT
ncbi:MAG: sterol desaturase family protein [Blastocatellia bacterium]|nr:sterol desaturase family protein [Blastocatellia bacterium]